jgi:hypothetical protein
MRRFILWDFSRISWQYNVMVALILAFIFLTPRSLFLDQPKPSHVAMLEEGKFYFEPELFAGQRDETVQARTAEELIQKRFRLKTSIRRIEPVRDAEGELKGYMAHSRP